MGNIIIKKRSIDEFDMACYIVPSFVGRDVNEVYHALIKKYTHHKVYIIANRLTSLLLDRENVIFIYYNYNDNTVKSIRIYN